MTQQTNAQQLSDDLQTSIKNRTGNTVMLMHSTATELHTELSRLSAIELERDQLAEMNTQLREQNEQVDAINNQLRTQVDTLETKLNEALQQPWPEWATSIMKTVREHSGYDGYDDAEGVDLPEEVREHCEEMDAAVERERAERIKAQGEAKQLAKMLDEADAKVNALRAQVERLQSIPSGLRVGDSHMESLIKAATQSHADTSDAMRWLVRQIAKPTDDVEQVQVGPTDEDRHKALIQIGQAAMAIGWRDGELADFVCHRLQSGKPVAWRDLADGEIISIGDRVFSGGKKWELVDEDQTHMVGREFDSRVSWPVMRLATQPAASEPLPSLAEADLKWLKRFKETTEDDQSYDVPKEHMTRLVELGALRWCGGSRYAITAFGEFAADPGGQFSGALPLKTYDDHMAMSNTEYRTRINNTSQTINGNG